VAPNQELEGPLVVARDKSFQQLCIIEFGILAVQGDPAQLSEDTVKLAGRHGASSLP
jgi:hypothetical protein